MDILQSHPCMKHTHNMREPLLLLMLQMLLVCIQDMMRCLEFMLLLVLLLLQAWIWVTWMDLQEIPTHPWVQWFHPTHQWVPLHLPCQVLLLQSNPKAPLVSQGHLPLQVLWLLLLPEEDMEEISGTWFPCIYLNLLQLLLDKQDHLIITRQTLIEEWMSRLLIIILTIILMPVHPCLCLICSPFIAFSYQTNIITSFIIISVINFSLHLVSSSRLFISSVSFRERHWLIYILVFHSLFASSSHFFLIKCLDEEVRELFLPKWDNNCIYTFFFVVHKRKRQAETDGVLWEKKQRRGQEFTSHPTLFVDFRCLIKSNEIMSFRQNHFFSSKDGSGF